MYDFVSLVKQCAVDAVNAQKPDCVVLGRVIREEDIPKEIPLEIMLEQKAVIGREFLYNTASTYALKEDERLIMLRCEGGLKYLILDKLREESE
jgi:hypothetical protein